MSQNQLEPNQPTEYEKEQGEIAGMAHQISDEGTSQSIPSTSTNNDTQFLYVPRSTTEISDEDRASIEGKFDWAQFGDKLIPYLLRSQTKYVSFQMMDRNIFHNYKQFFKDEVYNCFTIDDLEMTKAEAKLFNQINFVHCGNSLGSLVYPNAGNLISVSDAKEMYEFFNFCYKKLIQKSINTSKGGFIRPDLNDYIPYVWIDYRQYVPLFYFDGECHHLEKSSVELKGWMLAYMKLFCKIQGIRKSLFDRSSLHVVHLEVVKPFFLAKTSFEECWPTNNKIESLIINIKQALVPCESNQENVKQEVTETAATSEKGSVGKSAPAKKSAKRKSVQYRTSDKPDRSTENKCKENTIPATISVKGSYDRCKLWQIPNYLFDKGGRPYFLIKAQVDTVPLNQCINLFPHSSSVVLVRVGEVAENFKLPLMSLVKAINYLRLTVYLPNEKQKKLLEDNKLDPVMGLMKLNTFVNNINCIRSVMSSSMLTEL